MGALRRFEDALRARGCKGNGRMHQCPAHDDRGPSLSVRKGDDGRVLMHCFAGCDAEDVVAALGLSLADLFDGPRPAGWTPPPPAPALPSWWSRSSSWDTCSPCCSVGLPTWDDVFWAQPDDVIDAHLAAILEEEALMLAVGKRMDRGR